MAGAQAIDTPQRTVARPLLRSISRRSDDEGHVRRVRIVFLIRALTIGGAERQLVELAKGLDSSVFDVTVLTLYSGGEFVRELTDSGARVLSLDKGGRWDLFGFLARLAKTLRRIRPDILHPYLAVQNIIAACVKPILPGTQIVWGIESAFFDGSQADWLNRVTFRLESLLSRVPRLVIFNSHAGKNYHLSSGFAPRRSAVIHNGIDMQRFAPDLVAGARTRAKWKVKDGAFLIGIVARLDPIKDHTTFLRAAARFVSTRPDARFVCVGDGSAAYAGRLLALCEELGLGDRVIWPGSVFDGMSAAYSAMNICTSSSYAEGTSNSIAEAMACGVPCVVTDVGDSRLIVGDTGEVVPARDAEALAAGWSRLAQRIEDQRDLPILTRERISSQLSLGSLVENTSKALLNLLD